MTSRRPTVSPEDLAKLHAEWKERDRRHAAEREQEVQRLLQEILPLASDLAAVGIRVQSAWDLVNDRKSYPETFPILIRHLFRGYSPRNLEAIVRSLTVVEARGVAHEPLIRLLTSLPKPQTIHEASVFWAIGNALAVTAPLSAMEQLSELAVDPRYECARDGLVRGLGRWKSSRAVAILKQMLEIPDAQMAALEAIRKLRPLSLAPELIELSKTGGDYVKKEAKKALEQIAKRGWDDATAG